MRRAVPRPGAGSVIPRKEFCRRQRLWCVWRCYAPGQLLQAVCEEDVQGDGDEDLSGTVDAPDPGRRGAGSRVRAPRRPFASAPAPAAQR